MRNGSYANHHWLHVRACYYWCDVHSMPDTQVSGCNQATLHCIYAPAECFQQSSIQNKYVILWAMHKLGIDEIMVRLVKSIYKDIRTVWELEMGAAMFGLGVGKHEGSVFSPLLLIIMLEAGYPFRNNWASSRENLSSGCPAKRVSN